MISIITAAYNAQTTLSETIASVLAQTYREWEMMVIDDGSTDDTASIAFQASQADKRIRLIMQPNMGVAQARNFGLLVSKFPFIAFLDADDMWMPDKLERQLVFMQAAKSAFSFTAYRKFRGSEIGPKIEVPRFLDYRTLLKTRPIACSSVMVNRDLVDVEMPDTHPEDLAAWLTILRHVVGHGLNTDLLRLRKAQKSRSSNKVKAALGVWRVYRTHEHLNTLMSAWYFAHYAINSLR